VNSRAAALRGRDISVGDRIPTLQVDVSASRIIATALASRDFMAIHHDVAHAARQGLPDIILNVIATGGFLERLVEEWAGPEVMLTSIKFRIGESVVPGDSARFDAEVTGKDVCGVECQVQLVINVSTEKGTHAVGTMKFTVPN
jgi:acyl dehydratase